jgi:serine/threonine protein kinase
MEAIQDKYTMLQKEIVQKNQDIVSIKIIDWGSICFIPKLKMFNTCTHSLSAPELLNLEIIRNPDSRYSKYYLGNIGKYSIKNDIFSLGLVIKYLVYKNYYQPIEIFKYSRQRNFVPFIVSNSIKGSSSINVDDFDIDFLNICQKMLCCDHSKRPTALELWRDKYFDTFRKNDIFVKNIDSIDFSDELIEDYETKHKFTMKDREKIIQWVYPEIENVKKLHMFTLGIWIFDKFLSLTEEEVLKDDWEQKRCPRWAIKSILQNRFLQ